MRLYARLALSYLQTAFTLYLLINQFIHQSQVITKVGYSEKSTGFPVSYA